MIGARTCKGFYVPFQNHECSIGDLFFGVNRSSAGDIEHHASGQQNYFLNKFGNRILLGLNVDIFYLTPRGTPERLNKGVGSCQRISDRNCCP